MLCNFLSPRCIIYHACSRARIVSSFGFGQFLSLTVYICMPCTGQTQDKASDWAGTAQDKASSAMDQAGSKANEAKHHVGAKTEQAKQNLS